jgi:hypothetical protein
MPAPVNQTPPDEVDGLRARLGFWLRNDASRLLWPARCLICGESAEDARDLCRACAAALPWNQVACDRCALPLAAPGTCGACLRRAAAVWPRSMPPAATGSRSIGCCCASSSTTTSPPATCCPN